MKGANTKGRPPSHSDIASADHAQANESGGTNVTTLDSAADLAAREFLPGSEERAYTHGKTPAKLIGGDLSSFHLRLFRGAQWVSRLFLAALTLRLRGHRRSSRMG